MAESWVLLYYDYYNRGTHKNLLVHKNTDPFFSIVGKKVLGRRHLHRPFNGTLMAFQQCSLIMKIGSSPLTLVPWSTHYTLTQ